MIISAFHASCSTPGPGSSPARSSSARDGFSDGKLVVSPQRGRPVKRKAESLPSPADFKPVVSGASNAPATAVEPKSPSPKKFWFDYRFQPSPGQRTWTLDEKDTWTEEYGNGVRSRFKLAERAMHDEASGIIVSKITGDPKATMTSNDGGFRVFIPDVGSPHMRLWFRNKINGQWEAWKFLSDMQCVE